MSEVTDLLADILSYSPTEKGEIRRIRPAIRTSENGLNTTYSPNSPLSPTIPLKSNSPSSPSESDIEKIRTWLYRIGEPESDHCLVIDKCKSDPHALEYFLRHAHGEFEQSYTVTDERR
ncbi:hypothetical protein [Nitrosomonas sp. Is37]|uniref:hypothetical protein n=1 Tax=Nitrosomonas sp. Is37 TaxID=3080535 RepID=UPI00294AA352|nr:hypothetical protein [Nitrosomonas sp. Is37]MDV6345405.1 hypothetical protein [Nitrosomonas sp. Is37]